MDWAEEKYDVSAANPSRVSVNSAMTLSTSPLIFLLLLLLLGPETPDRAGEDGPPGALPLHPPAHVLGFVRPAGR